MKKNFFKKISLVISSFFVFVNDCLAAGLLADPSAVKSNADALAGGIGLNQTLTIGGVMGLVIKAFLGLLGIVFLVLVVYAGYSWMTARGQEEKVTRAQETLQRAIIGLIITIAAYAITYFVFNALPGGSGGAGGVGGGSEGL